MREWFILHVAPDADHLRRWLPALNVEVREFKHQRHRRKQKPITCQSFPGYLFVRCDLADEGWTQVAQLDGVIRFLGADPAHPTALPDEEMARVVALHEKEFLTTEDVRGLPALLKGITVRIEAGPFASFPGVVIKDEKGLVELDVSIFGRTSKATIKREDVSPV